MKRQTYFLKAMGLVFGAGIFFSCDPINNNPTFDEPMVPAPEVVFTGLLQGNKIAQFKANELGNPMDMMDIKGLPSSESIISIDYRPATGQLYGLANSSRLYLINEKNGMATPLGSMSFNPMVEGTNASIDFNPTVDRIRLVTESGQNLRLHPELGTVVATDGNINGGINPKIGAVAYTNSMAGAASTLLYDIDFEADKLFIQNPPNDGGLQEVGSLGVDFMGIGDFDIMPDNSVSLAVTFHENESKLFTIDLQSGKATWVGKTNLPIISLAFKTNPVAYATNCDNELFRFNPDAPMMNKVALQGMMQDEHVVGLDFRPANGTLYAITNKSRLITINTANGATSQIGMGLNPMLEGKTFGFDFNPTVDRIRLVSNTGQNLRLHPDLGTVVATDGNLKPGTPQVNGAAYINNFPGTTTTLLYVLDAKEDMLYIQNPPNDGGLEPVGKLGVNFSDDNGFDIGGFSNMAYALLKVNSKSAIYCINLETGKATKHSDFDIEVTAFTIGLGF